MRREHAKTQSTVGDDAEVACLVLNARPCAGMQSTQAEQDTIVHRPRWWVSRSAWTLLDQGLFALSNFGLNILVARWLSPAEYGAFTVAFSVFLLVGALHIAVLTEPLLIFGPKTYQDVLVDYFDTAISLHWWFSLLAGMFLAIGGLLCWLFGEVTLSVSLLALVVTTPFMLLLWLLRGMCYVQSDQIFLAAWSGGLYLALLVLGVVALVSQGWLSTTSSLALMGGVSSVVSLWLAFRLGVHWRGTHKEPLRRDALASHWQYGRWSAATYAGIWIPENLFYLLVSYWGGLSASGALRALVNLLMPLLRMQAALVPLLLTSFARAWTATQVRHVYGLLGVLTSGAIGYWLLLGLYHQPVLRWLYDGQYQEYGAYLWLLGFIPCCGAISTVLSAMLRARNRPSLVFWAHTTTAGVVLTLGVGFVVTWGIGGAVWGMVLAGVVTVLALCKSAWGVRWVEREELSS